MVRAERARTEGRNEGETREGGMRMVWGDGLGNGGQPLLSGSIREPRGDMGAGKRGRRKEEEEN